MSVLRPALDMRAKVNDGAAVARKSRSRIRIGIAWATRRSPSRFGPSREYGDQQGRNLASRLCDEAKPGQIVIASGVQIVEHRWAPSINQLNEGFNRPIRATKRELAPRSPAEPSCDGQAAPTPGRIMSTLV
jgi:hypothetical protein